jgi:putative restriction endonuclease
MNDGPMFEQGLKALAGRVLRRPKRDADRPDRDRLALRFASFRG